MGDVYHHAGERAIAARLRERPSMKQKRRIVMMANALKQSDQERHEWYDYFGRAEGLRLNNMSREHATRIINAYDAVEKYFFQMAMRDPS